MNPVEGRVESLRVVVCVSHPAPAAERLLEEAALMAQRLQAELATAFSGNPALLWSAALPFTRLVSRFGHSAGEFRPEQARRALRLAAAELERLAARVAERFALSFRFLELEAPLFVRALRPGDLLVADARELRALLAVTGELALPAGSVLILRTARPGPLVALSAGDRTTLSLVARLVGESGAGALVHVAPAASAEEIAAALPFPIPLDMHIHPAPDLETALEACRRDIVERGAAAVVVDGAIVGATLPALLEAIEEAAARRATTVQGRSFEPQKEANG